MTPLPREYQEQLERSTAEAHETAQRETRRALIRAGAGIVLWSLSGLLCFALAMRSTTPEDARIFLWLGVLVAGAGSLYSLLRAWVLGQHRGDW